MHPEVKVMDKEIQSSRFAHQEEKRQNKIQAAIEKRKMLIENPALMLSKSIKFNDTSATTMKEPSSTAIRDEQKKLERMKNKQIWELQGMIDFEFMMEETRRKNEIKMKEQKEKEEKMKAEKLNKMAELNRKRLIKEGEREKKLKEEAEEQERLAKKREEEENKRRALEQKKKEAEQEHLRQRHIQERIKDEEFKKQIESMVEAQHNVLIKKQEEMKKKEEIRMKNLEKNNREKKKKANKLAEATRLKVEHAIKNSEDKLKLQKEVLLYKYNMIVLLYYCSNMK